MFIANKLCIIRMDFRYAGDRSDCAEVCRRRWAPPTLGVTFDLGRVLVLAWKEPREQAVSVKDQLVFDEVRSKHSIVYTVVNHSPLKVMRGHSQNNDGRFIS